MTKTTFQVGDRVAFPQHGGAYWSAIPTHFSYGTVTSVTDKGTVTIDWDDGFQDVDPLYKPAELMTEADALEATCELC